jgi:predicted permease
MSNLLLYENYFAFLGLFSTLCGLWLGHVLLLHLSGMVFGHRYLLAVARRFRDPGSLIFLARKIITPPDKDEQK